MNLSLVAGTTSKSIGIFIGDSSVTTGAGLTGLVFNTASLVAYYFKPRISGATAITLATLASATAAWSSGGFVEIDATNMPGWYRLDIPDAALTGATSVLIGLKGATNMRPIQIEIELTATNNQDAVRGGMTALPNAVPGAAGGVFIAGSNAATTLASVTVSGTTTLTGAVSTGNWTFNTFTVSGTTLFSGNLGVSGTATLGGLSVAGGTTNLGTLHADTLTQIGTATRTGVGLASANLDTQLANILGDGAGSFPITVTVVDGAAAPLQNALVWVSDGTTAISHLTDASGNHTFSLAAATYTVAITKAGYSFTPTSRTVTGNQTGTLTNDLVMTAVSVPPAPPANPAKGTIHGNIVRSDGASPAGIQITATLAYRAGQERAVSVGNMLVPVVQQTTTDGSGDWEMDLFGNDDITPAGTYWVVEVPAANFRANVELEGGAVVNIDDLIV